MKNKIELQVRPKDVVGELLELMETDSEEVRFSSEENRREWEKGMRQVERIYRAVCTLNKGKILRAIRRCVPLRVRLEIRALCKKDKMSKAEFERRYHWELIDNTTFAPFEFFEALFPAPLAEGDRAAA